MVRATMLLLGIGVLAAMPSHADARDGCGRGYYFNGYTCAPEGYVGRPQQAAVYWAMIGH